MTHGNEISIPNVKYVNMKISEHGYEQRITMFLFKKQNFKDFLCVHAFKMFVLCIRFFM